MSANSVSQKTGVSSDVIKQMGLSKFEYDGQFGVYLAQDRVGRYVVLNNGRTYAMNTRNKGQALNAFDKHYGNTKSAEVKKGIEKANLNTALKGIPLGTQKVIRGLVESIGDRPTLARQTKEKTYILKKDKNKYTIEITDFGNTYESYANPTKKSYSFTL